MIKIIQITHDKNKIHTKNGDITHDNCFHTMFQ